MKKILFFILLFELFISERVQLEEKKYILKNPQWLCVTPMRLRSFCMSAVDSDTTKEYDNTNPDIIVIDIAQENSETWHTFSSSEISDRTCIEELNKIFKITDTENSIAPQNIKRVCFYGSMKKRKYSNNHLRYPESDIPSSRIYEEWKLAAIKTKLGNWVDPNYAKSN